MKKIAVFASGGGTDFQSVIEANKSEKFCEIALLIASKNDIGAIERLKSTVFHLAFLQKKTIPTLKNCTKN